MWAADECTDEGKTALSSKMRLRLKVCKQVIRHDHFSARDGAKLVQLRAKQSNSRSARSAMGVNIVQRTLLCHICYCCQNKSVSNRLTSIGRVYVRSESGRRILAGGGYFHFRWSGQTHSGDKQPCRRGNEIGKHQPVTRHILVRHLTFGCTSASRRSFASELCTYHMCPGLTHRLYRTFSDRTRKKSIDIYSSNPNRRAVQHNNLQASHGNDNNQHRRQMLPSFDVIQKAVGASKSVLRTKQMAKSPHTDNSESASASSMTTSRMNLLNIFSPKRRRRRIVKQVVEIQE